MLLWQLAEIKFEIRGNKCFYFILPNLIFILFYFSDLVLGRLKQAWFELYCWIRFDHISVSFRREREKHVFWFDNVPSHNALQMQM